MTLPASAEPRRNLTEHIYQRLKQDIFDFRLLPGDRITENVIAERMSASRTPVREALMRLQREGFVEVFYRSGWQIRPFDFQQFEQLYDVRVILEMAAVSRLCELQPTTELEALQAIWLVPIEERQSHGPSVCQLDEHFHLDLVRACGNPELARIHHDLTERLRIVRRIDFTRDNRIEATYREHAEILHSITQRRADQAQLLIRTHIEESKAEVRKITLHMLFEARQHQDDSRRLA